MDNDLQMMHSLHMFVYQPIRLVCSWGVVWSLQVLLKILSAGQCPHPCIQLLLLIVRSVCDHGFTVLNLAAGNRSCIFV